MSHQFQTAGYKPVHALKLQTRPNPTVSIGSKPAYKKSGFKPADFAEFNFNGVNPILLVLTIDVSTLYYNNNNNNNNNKFDERTVDGGGDIELGCTSHALEAESFFAHTVKAPIRGDLFSATINLVPNELKAANPCCFVPRVLGIGPLNTDKTACGLKARYANSLLQRVTDSPKDVVEICLSKLHDQLDKVKSCYSWVIKGGDKDIARNLLEDVLFIIEYGCKYLDHGQLHMGDDSVVKAIATDLILLENQIPFFILQDMFDCTLAKVKPEMSLIELLLPIVTSIKIFKADWNAKGLSDCNPQHFLGLLHALFRPPVDMEVVPFNSKIQPVTNLVKAGFEFQPNQSSSVWILAVQASEKSRFPFTKAVLKLPMIGCYKDHTEMVLRNLVAYEHSLATNKYFTSYMHSMSMLIKTKDDVAKLVEAGVIHNYMSSDEEVAHLFNSIIKHETCEDTLYEAELKKVNMYYNSGSAWLRRTCCHSPLSILSGLSNFAMFVLTLLQIIFTIKSATNTRS
ncbi:UPF0481 protein At3g47200-like [Bidens hawaiensis]|uniref:UPF0481 protein At3g47200-like n=1 Tax=Bidens hawaiensis TaxID=980011 RepID=UPI0040490728